MLTYAGRSRDLEIERVRALRVVRTNKSRGRFGGKLKKKKPKKCRVDKCQNIVCDTCMLSAIFTSLQPALGQPQGLQAALGRPQGLEPEGL
jgi:hypothetical protein